MADIYERVHYNYSTEGVRKIPCNCPFSCCQYGANNLSHGLVDIFLFCIPPAFRPIPQKQKDSFDAIQHMPIQSMLEIFRQIYDLRENVTFTLSEKALEIYEETNKQFIDDLNGAFAGDVTPKSKKGELVPKIAVANLVLQVSADSKLNRTVLNNIDTTLMISLLRIVYIMWSMERQKESIPYLTLNVLLWYVFLVHRERRYILKSALKVFLTDDTAENFTFSTK